MATIEKRIRTTKQNNGQEVHKVTYRVKIRVRGAEPQSATFDRITDAKQWAQRTESDIRAGKYSLTIEAQKHTLNEAIARYKSEVLPGKAPNTSKKQAAILNWWRM